MTTKEKMQILLDGGKLTSIHWAKNVYVHFDESGRLVWPDGRIFTDLINLVGCKVFIEPEDATLYEWGYKTNLGDYFKSEVFKTKKQAKKDFAGVPEYYLLRKFEPMETFKNKEQE